MKKRLLAIEAHSDDSAISALGFLDKFHDKYELHFLLLSVSSLYLHHCGLVSREQRLDEYQHYMDHLGGAWHQEEGLPLDADALLDTIPQRQLVAAIEKVISTVEPEVLLCQGPSFHHDHTITYESVIAATRPTARFCPAEIYVMENPTYVHSLGPATDFKPSLYCSLTETEIDTKLTVFRQCFPSQIRPGLNCLSPDGIKTWARYRGIECRREYAEAFQIYKIVI